MDQNDYKRLERAGYGRVRPEGNFGFNRKLLTSKLREVLIADHRVESAADLDAKRTWPERLAEKVFGGVIDNPLDVEVVRAVRQLTSNKGLVHQSFTPQDGVVLIAEDTDLPATTSAGIPITHRVNARYVTSNPELLLGKRVAAQFKDFARKQQILLGDLEVYARQVPAARPLLAASAAALGLVALDQSKANTLAISASEDEAKEAKAALNASIAEDEQRKREASVEVDRARLKRLEAQGAKLREKLGDF